MEIWKDIEDYETHYQVSDLGIVKSLKCGKERILKPHINSKNYYQVGLLLNGELKNKLISRLVAIAFHPNPENKRTVNHKNGITTDNRAVNLEWNTYSENHLHSFRELGRSNTQSCGKDNPTSKPVSQYSKSGTLIKTFECQHEVTRITGYDQGSISKACNGIAKTVGGYIWKFDNDK